MLQRLSYLVIAFLFISACGGGGGGSAPPAVNQAELITSESVVNPGAECPYGGTRVAAGIDANGDGVLQTEEESSFELLCANSAESFNGLVFRSDRTTQGVYELYRVYPDGSVLTRIDESDGEIGRVLSFAVSPDTTKVAYVKGENIYKALYIASLVSDTPPQRIDIEPGVRAYIQFNMGRDNVAWAPDGSRLAYVARREGEFDHELYSILPDGSDNTLIGNIVAVGGDVAGITWSPDSSKVAFLADRDTDGYVELYTVTPDGTELAKLNGPLVQATQNNVNGRVEDYKWSPDSLRIAYRADQEVSMRYELYSVRHDGTNNVKLNRATSSSVDPKYEWGPDSSRVSYIATDNSTALTNRGLFSVLPTGGGHQSLSGALATGRVITKYQWAPDSSRIAYISDQAIDNRYDLYTVSPTGGDLVRASGNMLANSILINELYWSPDSSVILFCADKEVDNVYELYITNYNGTVQRKISSPINHSDGDVQQYFSFSPDGTHVAYLADANMDVVNELYTVQLNDDPPGDIVTNLVDTNVSKFFWSPDSAGIAYGEYLVNSGFKSDINTVPTNGGERVKLITGIVDNGEVNNTVWVN